MLSMPDLVYISVDSLDGMSPNESSDEVENRLDEMTPAEGLPIQDDFPYQPWTMMRLLLRYFRYDRIPCRTTPISNLLSRNPDAFKTEIASGVMADSWSVDYCIDEIPGEIETAIIMMKHLRRSGSMPVWTGGQSMAMTVAAICVEKALKTLLTITDNGTLEHAPRRTHDLRQLWDDLSGPL